jgi:hypothetical protein
MGDTAVVQTKAPPVVINITEGKPDRDPAHVSIGDRLQFVNNDNEDYQILGLKIARYLGTHILLPAQGSVMLSIDDATPKGQSTYWLSPTNLWYGIRLVAAEAVVGFIPQDAGGGGGQIIVDP